MVGVSSPESIDHSSGTRWKRLMVSKFARPSLTWWTSAWYSACTRRIADQIGARGEGDSLLPRQVLERGKVGRDQHTEKFVPVANHRRRRPPAGCVQLAFDGLGSDHLSARGLEQLLLAVGDVEKSISVERRYRRCGTSRRLRWLHGWPPACANSRQRQRVPSPAIHHRERSGIPPTRSACPPSRCDDFAHCSGPARARFR
jgi:hypothetical protein